MISIYKLQNVLPYCLIKRINKILGIRNSEIWLFNDVSKILVKSNLSSCMPKTSRMAAMQEIGKYFELIICSQYLQCIIQNFTCHLGRDYDYQNYLIWAGNYHPYDSNKLYESKISGAVTEIRNSTLKSSLGNNDEDLWAYTCSSDATGQGKTLSLSYKNIQCHKSKHYAKSL